MGYNHNNLSLTFKHATQSSLLIFGYPTRADRDCLLQDFQPRKCCVLKCVRLAFVATAKRVKTK